MFLEKSKSPNGKGYYLRIRERMNVNGKRVKVTLLNIGFVSEENVEEINKWKWFVETDKKVQGEIEKLKEELLEEEEDGTQNSINLGCCFVEQVLAVYSIREILANYQRNHDFDYQLYQDIIFLVEASVLNPSSIEDAVNRQDRYYTFYNVKLWDAYRSLDHIHANMDRILDHFASTSLRLFADSDSVFYLDGSNTYTYSPGDEPGGLRRTGASKEGVYLPIVGMQLLTSHNGFPITFLAHGGNRNDSSQFIPSMKKLERSVGNRRVLSCGDAGYYSATNNFYMAGRNINNLYNNGYLFSRSVNTIGESDRNWILDRHGWRDISGNLIDPDGKDFDEVTFRYKERKISRKDDVWRNDKSGKLSVEVNLKQVVFYNEAYKEVRTKSIGRKVERAFEIKENPNEEIERNLKKTTGSYSNFKSTNPEATVDLKKVQKDLSMAGYLLLETSEREISPMALLHIYNDKFWIEWLFRILKSDLNLRPFYLRLPAHIEAFMLIRFMALVVVRALQHVLGYKYSVKKIVDSLKNFSCVPYKNKFIVYGRNEVIKELESFFGYHFSGEMTRKELDTIFSYKNLSGFWGRQFCEIFSDPPGLKLSEADKEELTRNSKAHFRKK